MNKTITIIVALLSGFSIAHGQVNRAATVRQLDEVKDNVSVISGRVTIVETKLENLSGGAALKLYHYGDPDIVVTPANFFGFNPVTGTITNYSSSGPADVVIPYEIGGVPVVAIGDEAFRYDRRVTKITSPRTLTNIGYGAFFSSYLTTLTAPALTNIGDYAFYYCSALTSVYYGSDKPMEGKGIYDSTPANLVNYITDPTATGWGATFGGRPVVRLTLHADDVIVKGKSLPAQVKSLEDVLIQGLPLPAIDVDTAYDYQIREQVQRLTDILRSFEKVN